MLKLIKKLFRQYSEAGLSTLDIEIKRNKAAYYRYDKEIDRLHEDTARFNACCAGCFYGMYFHDLCDKKKRCSINLIRLLRKRGKINDLKLANSIDC